MNESPNKESLKNIHPDIAYASLCETAMSREMVRKRLKAVHEICREQYMSGSKDFCWSTLIDRISKNGGPTRASGTAFKPPYRDLVRVWAEFAGGQMLDAKTVKRGQEEQAAVDFLSRYVSEHDCLPPWHEIMQNVVPKRVSPSWRADHVNRCVDAWKRKSLESIPEEVVTVCECLFVRNGAVPAIVELDEGLKQRNISIPMDQMGVYVKRWLQIEFLYQTLAFQPTNDVTEFRWLALHRELVEWRPFVITFLALHKSEHQLKAAKLALHTFFSHYLVGYGLPLTPREFLRKGIEIPVFARSCLSHLVYAQQSRRVLLVRSFIEHVLNSDMFLTRDENGYPVRSEKHENPISWQVDPVAEASITKRKKRVPKGGFQDPGLYFITDINPKLEQWRIYAVGWLASVNANLSAAQAAVRQIIVDYIVRERLPPDPFVLLSVAWQQENTFPSYQHTALKGIKNVTEAALKASEFIDHVLMTHYSAEDDFGTRVVSGDFRNFLRDQIDDMPLRSRFATKSNKDVLPTRYLRYLRQLICPDGSRYFRDLKWAQDAMPNGDWYEIPAKVIDENDPDCIWRTRTLHDGRTVLEMWSPVRTMALMMKLELPLRTIQVRLLDSGEADTWRYEGSTVERNNRGEWNYRAGGFAKNNGQIVRDVGSIERHAGLFRRSPDAASGKVLTALYINTNKTRDQGKEQWDRGYIVPWQHGKVLYWCERLRNWQEKYNPIGALVPATDLGNKHLGIKSDAQKRLMGSTAFLFRDPTVPGAGAAWPITEGGLVFLWVKILQKLEDICEEKGHKSADGSRLRFVPESENPASTATFYPLHSLRVSLITHYATEGGVEMHILSECIAGHARILMTLYYKKSGVVYVSEAMDTASEKLRDETVEQRDFTRWLKEATLKQIEVNSASVDASVSQAVQEAVARGGANLLRTNLGLCAKGGMACDSGGIYQDDETGGVSYGPVPGYPQQKNCVRCKWFLTGPAFLHALVHHWNLLHFNLGDSGRRYLDTAAEIAELEAEKFNCQKLNVEFTREARLQDLMHSSAVIYDGNEKLAADSLATMKLIVRCKHIIDSSKDHNSGVVLVAVGGMEEAAINVRECSELEQVLSTALGATVYVDDDVHKAVLKAGNAFDRMLAMNGKEPVFFKLGEKELPSVVAHMTRLLQAYAGSIGRAVSFVEGAEQLTRLGLFGDTGELLSLASAGSSLQLVGRDDRGPILAQGDPKIIPLQLADDLLVEG